MSTSKIAGLVPIAKSAFPLRKITKKVGGCNLDDMDFLKIGVSTSKNPI
jgi:hypothetical protein